MKQSDHDGRQAVRFWDHHFPKLKSAKGVRQKAPPGAMIAVAREPVVYCGAAFNAKQSSVGGDKNVTLSFFAA